MAKKKKFYSGSLGDLYETIGDSQDEQLPMSPIESMATTRSGPQEVSTISQLQMQEPKNFWQLFLGYLGDPKYEQTQANRRERHNQDLLERIELEAKAIGNEMQRYKTPYYRSSTTQLPTPPRHNYQPLLRSYRGGIRRLYNRQ